jgi:Flp pilus assembly protein TadG
MRPLRLRKLIKSDRGAFAVLFAILLPVIVGFVGLGVEAALWYLSKRNLMAAADAAAMAAVFEKVKGSDAATIESVATTEATRNGWKAANGSLAVHNPPLSPSAYSADSSAVQVALTQNVSLIFAAVFMDANSITLNAKSTAKSVSGAGGGSACMLGLHTTQAKTIEFSGNVNLDMPDCAVASNSNANDSISLTGSASVAVYSAQAVGVISDAHSHLTTSHGKTDYASAVTDPYSSLTVPSIGSTCDQNEYRVKANNSASLSASGTTPYVFCNGLDIKGSLTLGAGTYVINKGTFNLNATGSLTGTNVTFILTSTSGSDYAKFDLNGSASVNITAPSTGTYAGVLMYGDRNGPYQDNHINGNSSAIYNGALYFPVGHMDFNGNSKSGSSACTQLIAKTIKMNGNAGITNSGCSTLGAKSISLGTTVSVVE